MGWLVAGVIIAGAAMLAGVALIVFRRQGRSGAADARRYAAWLLRTRQLLLDANYEPTNASERLLLWSQQTGDESGSRMGDPGGARGTLILDLRTPVCWPVQDGSA